MSSAPQEKLLPQNLDAERAVLGSILIDAGGMRQARSVIAADDFYREAHRTIYVAMDALFASGEPVDLLTVGDELERLGKLEECGGHSALSQLANGVPTSVNLTAYAQIVARTATMRRLIHTAGQIAALAYNEPDTDAALSQSRELLRQVEQGRRNGYDGITFAAAVDDWLAAIYANMDSGKPRGAVSGFSQLDAFTMGFKPGELWYVPGRPGSGKSAWALAVAEHNAKRFAVEGSGTVEYVTLEMRATLQVQRILAARAGINGRVLRSDFYDGETFQEDLFRKAEQRAISERRAIGSHLRFYDRPIRMEALGAYLARAVDERGCQLAVVDYLTLISPDDRDRADQYQRVTKLSRALKELAMTLDIPIICLLQMNREAEHRENKRPVLSDLRDSGGLEQDADGVIGIYRPAYYNHARAASDVAFAQFMELWIIKARSSIANAFAPVRFEEEYTRVSNWPQAWDYPADDSRPGSK